MKRSDPFVSLVSPAWDLTWFVVPGLLAAAWGLGIGLLDPTPEDSSLGLWILGVLLVDVAHVYASLYRTYLDPVARRTHRKRLIWAPILCAWFGFLLHLESPRLFWSVLAYVAIFHFIKQQVGFALLYVKAGDESSLDRKLTVWAMWTATLVPVVYWHTSLPRNIAWFMQGDLVEWIPPALGAMVLWAQAPLWLVFLGRRAWLARAGRPNPMVPALVGVTALCWNLGIVVFDDDRIFTITNVFLHGIPYMALVWLAGGRDRIQGLLSRRSKRPWGLLTLLGVFYGVLVILAFTEEALWDRWVWHDHPELFGVAQGGPGPESMAMAALVALLTVPQATHYLLDRWIWRVGPNNPELARQLGFQRRS